MLLLSVSQRDAVKVYLRRQCSRCLRHSQSQLALFFPLSKRRSSSLPFSAFLMQHFRMTLARLFLGRAARNPISFYIWQNANAVWRSKWIVSRSVSLFPLQAFCNLVRKYPWACSKQRVNFFLMRVKTV